jgi:hypothetical protein
MKKLLLLLLLSLGFNSYGETYICAFQCLWQDDICQIDYRRVDNEFFQIVYLDALSNESTGGIYHIKESDSFLSLSNIVLPEDDFALIHSAIINKNTMRYVMTQTTQDNFDLPKPLYVSHAVGKCKVTY